MVKFEDAMHLFGLNLGMKPNKWLDYFQSIVTLELEMGNLVLFLTNLRIIKDL